MWWRAIVSWAITSSETPPSRDVVPTKYSSTTSWESPIASNTCAPVYEAMVLIPIFDITFKTPLPRLLIKFFTAFSGVIPVMTP